MSPHTICRSNWNNWDNRVCPEENWWIESSVNKVWSVVIFKEAIEQQCEDTNVYWICWHICNNLNWATNVIRLNFDTWTFESFDPFLFSVKSNSSGKRERHQISWEHKDETQNQSYQRNDKHHYLHLEILFKQLDLRIINIEQF